jgi:hypothetical protein
VEFDIAIDISDGRELGLGLMDVGFVQEVSRTGMVAAHNAKQQSIGEPSLRLGDRVVQVSGREPSHEDGAAGNVLPYLRLAMCGGASPLMLRIRRGEFVPTPETNSRRVETVTVTKVPSAKPEKPQAPLSQKSGYFCFQSAALRSVEAIRKLAPGRRAPKPSPLDMWRVGEKAKPFEKVDAKVSDEPGTPSTRGPSSAHSQSSDAEFVEGIPPLPCLTLPGIVRRVA